MFFNIILTMLAITLSILMPLWISERQPDNKPKNLVKYFFNTNLVTWLISLAMLIVALISIWK